MDLLTAKLYIFIDGLFINNKNLSFQIGFKVIFANKNTLITRNKFIINGNLIYSNLTKSKQIIRSVLASKIYNIVTGADIAFAISSIFKIIVK